MTASHAPSPTRRQVRQAWRWLLRRERGGRRDERAFERWLAADPRHLHAYAEAEATWRLSVAPAQRVAAGETAALRRYLSRMADPVPAPSRSPWIGAGLAACLLCGVLWAGGWLRPVEAWQNLQASEASGIGQVREVRLADGSRVVLDSDSALRVRLDGPERRVELLRGGAWFEVRHDGRPFRVDAGAAQVRVVGTAFEVRRRRGDTRVIVGEGRVEVDGTGGGRRLLGPGDAVQVEEGRLGEVVPVNLATLSWRDGRLYFQQLPLAQVLEALSAYYPGRILLLDPELGARRVSVALPGHDPMQALDSLCAVLGCRVQPLFGRLVLVR